MIISVSELANDFESGTRIVRHVATATVTNQTAAVLVLHPEILGGGALLLGEY